MSNKEKMIYLNTPITQKDSDIIGLSVYAEKISDAIDEGAQMIAITSPFGSGKTSVIDLLREKRVKNKKEYILKIPMWSQLHQLEDKTNELHRNFLYQISSLINHKRGTYVSRRLSNNYGLLTLHANKNRFWFFFTIALLLGCSAWCVNHFSDKLENYITILDGKTEYLTIALVVLAIYIGVVVLSRAEILFSSQKSENVRTIEEDEIIDLYRTEILKHGNRLGCFIRRKTQNWKHRPFRERRYIIVVEDLDRTNDGSSVIEFLTELRKYYLPTNYSNCKSAFFKNKVVFIVNIKSESVLLTEIKNKTIKKSAEENQAAIDNQEFVINNDSDSLYAKIFDFVLDLQTINIIDYETVLDGLLKAKKETLKGFGMDVDGKLTEISGMLWIIRGQTLDIREIKNRLNKAFLIFETLRDRFPNNDQISFEKCAVVAYLTTAFEHEFHITGDEAFQKLIELNIQNELGIESCKNVLSTIKNDDYIKAVFELVEAKLIDETYRMYFYNYPKDSRIYTYNESCVQKAILYGEDSEELDSAIDNILKSESKIIEDSFFKMNQLKLRLPVIVFQNEKLYLQALSIVPDEIITWMDKFDKSPSALDKNKSEILRILNYDLERSVYNEECAQRFCKSWENTFEEDFLLKLRECLCEHYPNEILWYRQLFFGVHNLISIPEMNSLSFLDSIKLINISHKNFDTNELKYLVDRFSRLELFSQQESDALEDFLVMVADIIDDEDFVNLCLIFMKKINRIISKFEEKICYLLQLSADDDEEEYFITEKSQEMIFKEYQELINQIDAEKLSENTLININEIEKYGGYERYDIDVAYSLYRSGYFTKNIIILLLKGESIDFEDDNICNTIKTSIDWFLKIPMAFYKLRHTIIECAKTLTSTYMFLFSDSMPVLKLDEFVTLKKRQDVDETNILQFIPVKIATENEAKFLSDYFCRKKQNNNIAFAFLKYISEMDNDVAKYCFKFLDFNLSIQYYKFSRDKRNYIKEVFEDIMDLNTPEGKLQFMEITQCLDSVLESSLADDLEDNTDLQREYVNAVNIISLSNPKSITATTLKNLYSLNLVYSMNDVVTDRYYRDKKYDFYVVSKTNYHKKFVIDSLDKAEVLWPIYVKLFKQNYYKNACRYMSNNHDFLTKLMENNEYVNCDKDTRMCMSAILQDSDCIKDALIYGIDFAKQYFSEIKGFKDYNAAATFINIIESTPQLLLSEEVYKNTYEKLLNPHLKGRYTTLRKRNGCKK